MEHPVESDFWFWEKVALAKYLANAFFGQIISLLRFFYIRPIIKIAVMKCFGQKIAVMKFAVLKFA
jgi:hypothetical protein